MSRNEALQTAADLELGAAAFERHAETCQEAALAAKSASELWRLLAEEELARARADEMLVLAQRLREEAERGASARDLA